MKNFTKEAEKLLPEKIIKLMNDRKISSATYPNGYNIAIDDCTPIVADLLRQVAELKKDNLALATRRLRVVEEKFEDKK